MHIVRHSSKKDLFLIFAEKWKNNADMKMDQEIKT